MTAVDQNLRLESLHERHTGLTPALGDSFFEAASVCLSRHHNSPVKVEIARKGGTSIWIVEFKRPDARMLNAWANDLPAIVAVVGFKERAVAVQKVSDSE